MEVSVKNDHCFDRLAIEPPICLAMWPYPIQARSGLIQGAPLTCFSHGVNLFSAWK